jgi:signal transduction histidine kinase
VDHLNSTEIIVTDKGVGIPQEVLEKLFLIDSRYNTIGTSQEQGIGLGLILCKDLIEKHGGNIKVKSIVGKGSEFTVILPKGKS